MAHKVEPMDLDSIDCEFDNKENSFHHNNVLQCTEKGYEELDVSELNMKLRYSMTSAASSMSKSYVDNHSLDTEDSLNCTINEGNNLTRSYNSALTKNDNVNKVKSLPLQSLPKDQFLDGNRNTTAVRQLDTAITTITISGNDDENVSLPSSSSSAMQTPEATSPIKDLQRDGSSPIMRGLKSVLNMFRPSTSPIPPVEYESNSSQTPEVNPANITVMNESNNSHKIAVSTPIQAHKSKEDSLKRCSPLKESITFNDEIERELLWKNETTIFFNHERIPKHKLFLLQGKAAPEETKDFDKSLNSTVEYMDVSYNDSQTDKTVTDMLDVKSDGVESDGEFLDCETTFTKNVSPAKDVNSKDNEVSNNVTVEYLMKQASKVMLNITVPLTDENLNVNNVLENSVKNILNNNSKVETSTVPSNSISKNIEIQENPDNITSNKTSDTLKDNVVAIENAIATTADVSLDSIDANATKIVENVTNAIHDTLDSSHQVEKYKETNDSYEIVQNLQSHTLETPIVDINIDSLTTNYELDSLEPNIVKSDAIVGTVKDNEEIKTTTSIANNDLEAQTLANTSEFISDTTLKSIKITETTLGSLKEVPANIPLPDDDEFEKFVTPSVKDSIIHSLDNDVVDYSKFPMISKNAEDMAIINDSTNLEIDATLDLVTPINFNHSDLSQILKDIDSIINSDCTTIVTDKKEAEILLKSEDQQMLQNLTVTMDMCESSMKPEILPDILNHTTTTSNIENINTSVNYEVENSIQSIYLPLVENQQNSEIVNKSSEVLEDQLFVDKTKVLDDSNGNQTNSILTNLQPNILINESASSFIVDKETKDMIHKTFYPTEEASKVAYESINVTLVGDVGKSELLIKSENIEDKLNTDTKKLHKSDAVINNDSVSFITTEITTEIIADNKKQEIDTISTDNKRYMVETQKQHESSETNNSDIIDHIDVKDNNRIFEDKDHVTITATENKINMNILQATDECLIKCGNEMNLTQEINPEEQAHDIITNPEIGPHDLNITSTEKTCNENTPSIVNKNNEYVINSIHEKPINVLCNEQSLNEIKSSATQKSIPNDLNNVDDEIVVSENNSPYVSVAGNLTMESELVPKENIESMENRIVSDCQTSSPPIVSKGYNFNFDEIDDPFASKIKIKQSPPPESPRHNHSLLDKQSIEKEINKDKDMAQTESKRKFNSTFNNKGKVKERAHNSTNINDTSAVHSMPENVSNNTEIDTCKHADNNQSIKTDTDCKDIYNEINLTKENINTTVVVSLDATPKMNESTTEIKASSPEPSNYFSLKLLTVENTKSRNVFNLPEIDDINFNPFLTRSKIAASPDASMIIGDANNVIESIEPKTPVDKMDTELMEKESLTNTSTATCSSKATDDKDITVREIHTEDEDTEEGPFLEAEEDKISNFDDDNDDMMQFPECPPREQENAETGELFIDAQAFEFLLNQNTTNVVADSGKESLFLKFDPLFAKRISSDGVFAALSKIQKRQSTPSKLATAKSESTQKISSQPTTSQEIQTLNTPNDIDGKAMFEGINEEQNVITSKPTMVVTPAVNPVPLPRKSLTPTRTNRRSLTFTSPAMAVIDRLLSMSANNSLFGEEAITNISQEQHEADLALTQLRELLAEKEIHVYNLRLESKNLRERLSTMETQIKSLETESQERLKKINDLNEKLAEKSKMNKSMAAVVEEYERTIASLIAETEQDKKRHAEEKMKLITERDEQVAHLASMEVSFNDLHMKYEKSKQVIFTYKANEEKLKASVKEYEENFTKMLNNYELLKQHATSKLNHANQELEKMNRAHNSEVLKLNAMMKRKELHITSLEETLAQKTKANEELTAICEELINKVG